MIVDCHAHFDARVLDVGTLVDKLDEQAIGRAVLIARITETVEPEKSAVLLAVQRHMMNSSVLRQAAAAASLTFYDGHGRLRPVWKPFTRGRAGYVKAMRPDNESVMAAVAKAPDRFWAWVFLNPARGGAAGGSAADELERWRTAPGVVGVKVHPYWHRYPITALAPALENAERRGLPVLVHLGFGAQGDYRWLLETFPRLAVIFAHAGMPYFKALWPLVRGRARTYVDLSSPHLSERFVRAVVAAVGPEKCLYGTDSPYGFSLLDGSYDYGRVKGWIDRLPVDTRTRGRILGDNFCELIGA